MENLDTIKAGWNKQKNIRPAFSCNFVLKDL